VYGGIDMEEHDGVFMPIDLIWNDRDSTFEIGRLAD
jgi:hypothetical protein